MRCKPSVPHVYHRAGAPAAWWLMHRPSPTCAGDPGDVADLMRGTAAGVRTASGCTWTAGLLGDTLAFTAPGYVDTSFTPPAGDLPITLSAWARLDTVGSFPIILSYCTSGTLSLELRCSVSTGKPQALNTADNSQVNDSVSIAGTGWHHLAATYNPVGSEIRLYRDGVLVGSSSVTPIAYPGGTHVVIGARPIASVYWEGAIDDARVYLRTLSAAEIRREYADPFWRLRKPRRAAYAAAAPPTPGGASAPSPLFFLHPGMIGGPNGFTMAPGRIEVFQPSGKAGFSPASLSPLLWLDAASGTWADAAKTTPAADGDPVYTWADRGDLAHDAAQATFAKRPTLVAGAQNGLPAVRFDGVDDILSTASVAIGGGSTTWFMVASFATISVHSTFLIYGPVVVFGSLQLGQWASDGQLALHNTQNNEGVIGTHDLHGTGFRVLEGRFTSPTTYDIWVDAASEGTASAAFTLASSNAFHVGGRLADTFSAIDIAEVIVYPTSLSDADRGKVETWLKAKWGTP